jgi:hypothetical protein
MPADNLNINQDLINEIKNISIEASDQIRRILSPSITYG